MQRACLNSMASQGKYQGEDGGGAGDQSLFVANHAY